MDEPNDLLNLIEKLRAPVAAAPDLASRVRVLLTFGGRLPLELGLGSLTPYQRALLDLVGGEREALDPSGARTFSHALGMTVYGRLVLCPRGGLGPLDRVFLGFDPGRGAEQEACRRASADPWTEAEARGADAWLAHVGQRGAANALARVRAAVDQTDPMLLYVRDWTYGTAPSLRPCLAPVGEAGPAARVRDLSRLPEPEAWDLPDRMLVAGMDLLLSAGFRGEEFNAQQFGPAAVERYFDRCAHAWEPPSGFTAPRPYGGAAWEKAESLAGLRARLASEWVFYREVNGLTLHKGVALFPRADLQPFTPATLPRGVAALLARQGVPAASASTLAELAQSWSRIALAGGETLGARKRGASGLNAFEELLVAALESVVEETASDFAMARGLRDLGAFLTALDEDRQEEVMSWGTSHYFCAVVPGSSLRTRAAAPVIPVPRALKAISARMAFNGWHYMPGHFDQARKPAGRHQFVPPRLPDRASWSDQRHAGHRAVRVRYSIRAPGPITAGGRAFPGFHDVRLMRCGGSPYELAELRRALAYVDLLGAFTQALLAHLAAGGPRLRVQAFTDEWYDGGGAA